jgi:hypothetical protein
MVRGVAEMNRRLLNLQRGTPEESLTAATNVAKKKTLPLAVSLCPWDTHALQNSGKVEEARLQGYEAHVVISFGEGLDYAVYVHEDLEANHPHGGQAKFLEEAINQSESTYARDLAAELRLDRLVR